MLKEQVWRNINCDVHAVQQNKIENGHKLKPFIVFNGGKRAVKRMKTGNYPENVLFPPQPMAG